MNEYKRQNERECPPVTKDPADQPKPPRTGDECPEPTKPTTRSCCRHRRVPRPSATARRGRGRPPNCLEDLINGQAAKIATAKKTEAFKTELEQLLTKAKAAAADYTKDKFDALVKEWVAPGHRDRQTDQNW